MEALLATKATKQRRTMVASDALEKSFKEGMKSLLKDRSDGGKKYKKSFLGSQAVDYLASNSHATTRDEAIELARALHRRGLFQNAMDATLDFYDSSMLYKFVKKADRYDHILRTKILQVGSANFHGGIRPYIENFQPET